MNGKADLALYIHPHDNGRFKALAILPDDEPAHFVLPLDRYQLENFMVNEVNPELNRIVSQPVYSQTLDIPSDTCDAHLHRIAKLKILNRVFIGSNPSYDAIRFENAVRNMSKDGKQKHIQIIAERFSLPWTLIYGKELHNGEKADRNAFWGFKNIIDTPLVREREIKYENKIESSNLHFGLNVNEHLDLEYSVTCIKDHKKFFKTFNNSRFKLRIRTKSSQLKSEFEKRRVIKDAISYYFCHANSMASTLDPSFKDIYIQMANQDFLTLEYLRNLPHQVKFISQPLIFINACESMDINPLFYDGFVPFFLSKSSKGVVGSFCRIPIIFACQFGKDFFNRIFRGQEIGKILLDLRNEFVLRHNLLGLFYVSYCFWRVSLDSTII